MFLLLGSYIPGALSRSLLAGWLRGRLTSRVKGRPVRLPDVSFRSVAPPSSPQNQNQRCGKGTVTHARLLCVCVCVRSLSKMRDRTKGQTKCAEVVR